MKNLRKSLVVGVMVLTALMTSGLGASQVKAAASAGDLIKMSGNAAVYYLGADSKRYVFPNSTTYFSWYSDFSGVVTIPATELQSYMLGGNVVMRAGTKLVKITTDPKVYAVEPNGVLRGIQSEAQAASLYGSNWNTKIVDVPDSYFTNYSIGTALALGSISAGSLVKNANATAVYYFDGTSYRSVASEAALMANRFDMANVLTISNTIIATGSAITGAETALVKTSQTPTTGSTTVITGSGLMVSLNANTPVATTIVSGNPTGGQSIAPLASFNLTAANDGAVTVTSLKLKRIGVSSDNTLSNIYLYNGNTKLTDAGSLSSGYVTFSNGTGIIVVPAGQTVTITVKADVAALASGNIGMGINAASDVISTGASVSGSFPVNGNLMSVTQVTDLATVSAGTVTPNGSPSNSVNAGTVASTLWSSQLNVGLKAVKLSYVSFRQIGSISADAIQNIKLYVNGTQAGVTSSIGSDGRVSFDLSAAPVLMNTGNSTVELRGDIVKGSNYNFIFSVQTAADMVLTDTNYGVNVALSGTLPLSPTTTIINAGSVSVQRDPLFTATQFVANQSQTVLGQWTMKAYGEDIKVQSLKVNLLLTNVNGSTTSGDGFNNVSLYVNGGQVGSSKNAVSNTSTDLTFGTTNLFTIPAGTTVTLTVKGDSVNSAANVSAVNASLKALSSAYQGVTSFTYTGELDNAGVTLTTGSSNAVASANGSFTSQTLASNTNKQKIGSFLIQANSVEGVNVTSLSIGVTDTSNFAATSSILNNLANLYVVTPDMANGSTPVNPGASNNFATNFTVAANQTAQVDVYADLSATMSPGFKTTLAGNGIGATSHQSVSVNSAIGQTIAVGTGSLQTLTLSGSTPVSQIVVGGTNNQAVATYNFVASATGGITINELGFFIASSTTALSTGVSSITVGGQTAAVVGGKALVTGLSIVVPASYGGIDVPVTANFAPVGLSGVSDQPVTITLGHVKTLAGGVTTPSDSTSPISGVVTFGTAGTGIFASSNQAGLNAKTMQLAGVAPIVSLVPASGNLTTGVVKIGSVTIVAPTGNVVLKDLPLVITASGATTTNANPGDLLVKDSSTGATITTTNSGNVVSFTNGYTIASGSVGKTLDIYANVTSIAGNAGTGRVTLGLNQTRTTFTWNDVNGNAPLDATYILNYPNTTVSIVN